MTPAEFSRPIALERIGPQGKTFTLCATAAECAALAARLKIPAVAEVNATVTVRLSKGGKRVRLEGRLRASLVQTCVVSLEPVNTALDEGFSRLYSVDAPDTGPEVVIDLDGDDPPDPVENGQIDMGEAAAEHLALAMDPFPRAPDARFEPPPEAGLPAPAGGNAFAVLAEHRKK